MNVVIDGNWQRNVAEKHVLGALYTVKDTSFFRQFAWDTKAGTYVMHFV